MSTDLGEVYKLQYQKQFVHYGSARVEITYTSVAQSTYNTATSETVAGSNTTHPSFYIIWDKTSLEKIPGIDIEDNETGIVFPALDIPEEPKLDDYFREGSNYWLVTGAYPDNFRAQWILKVKAYTREQA